MSSDLKEIKVEGIISQSGSKYKITTDDGTQYELSAIMLWESVAPDYGTGVFAQYIGKRAIATGLTEGYTIWKAQLIDVN
jgi:hypothetical protein